jgi:WhiB family redox-sensing transcriptional regulator
MNWLRAALCRAHTAAGRPDLWTADTTTAAETAAAKNICRTCPVRQDCLQYAMSIEAPSRRYGIFGGYTAAERDRLSRRGTALHGNAKTDPEHVRQLVEDYTASRGTRYGAIRHTARTLNLAENTVRDQLRRTA